MQRLLVQILFVFFSGADDPPLEPPSHVELNKDALLDRIQQQQLREQEVVTRTSDSVSEANEDDTETKSDEEDVDDEAKDEDSKRHDTKIGLL